VDVRDRLNLDLKRRVWYQPFCPSILDEEAARLLENGEIPNRYMTMAYRVRPEARDRLIGVIGPDGTCRPQMVDASYGRYHELLRALEKRIGIGAVLNTSLNLHGEPMVASPVDAIRTFARSGAEAMILDDYVVTHPSGEAA
jgi:carbamoyltransferase